MRKVAEAGVCELVGLLRSNARTQLFSRMSVLFFVSFSLFAFSLSLSLSLSVAFGLVGTGTAGEPWVVEPRKLEVEGEPQTEAAIAFAKLRDNYKLSHSALKLPEHRQFVEECLDMAKHLYKVPSAVRLRMCDDPRTACKRCVSVHMCNASCSAFKVFGHHRGEED